jgi:hypothetical protein
MLIAMRKTGLPNTEPMRHAGQMRSQPSVQRPRRLSPRRGMHGWLWPACALMLLAGPRPAHAAQQSQNGQPPAATQQTAAQNSGRRTPARPGRASASHRRTGEHAKNETPGQPAQEAATAPPAPAAPPPPDWPANHPPNPATVVWNSRGLEIQASNSSLDQILRAIAAETGAKVEGFGQDQRVFGDYGPGPAREVISRLLDGSGYNVLMIGGSGDQPPQQIILSASAAGTPAPPNTAPQSSEQQDEEQDAPIEQNVEQDYHPPQYPMPPRNPFGGPPPRAPQQIP